MPRTRRASQGGYCYHVLNRGNARRTVFHKDAHPSALLSSDAQPLPSGGLALKRWRFERLHAMAADRSCSSVSSSLPFDGTCLARTFQGLSHSRRQSSVGGAALRRTQCAACEPRGAGRGLAMVEPGGLARGCSTEAGGVDRATPGGLAQVRERAPD